ncbi:molecular chaperone HscC (plasmid) [Rahnella aquatilis]|jgi:molecular chaperone HscC|uniref:Heat shock protein 70 n=1 Tax=Rahnella sp. (strain Y9602) TaxID=2703885 RepID=A0A0H3FI89_RAHSY|nr:MULTISPECIES: molecular chaperone HscC [Rahnella]AFE60754.1 Heat shock protein 70 [Rahnella aquatilis HX2]AYA09511.1 molecular chaperone HscC [Rahnella aquatilis]ADW76066.1 Heat shock protein 70 [Rahnella aceris]MBU9843034.1 molecular chaperone HscC [Rahnella aceris]MBU9861076.1 molecular chaperone HscC [Rahnella aceris]
MLIGIDLGTSNCAVAIWQDGQSVLVPNVYGKNLTPSVIGLDDNGHVLVGAPAQARLFTHPDLTLSSFKRFMGTEHQFRLGHQNFRAEELSALLLRSLKADVEQHCGCEVKRAIITVPAYFNDIQRKAVKAAGELAGLHVERLLNEPTAASLAYGLVNQQEQKFLVFDLGGGTFDVSIIDMFEGVIEVRASSGDVFLGGDDFTRSLAGWMLAQYPELDKDDNALFGQLITLAEKAKCQLTTQDSTPLRYQWNDRSLNWTLTTEILAQCCESTLERMKKPVIQALRDARFSADEVDHVVLVGGATRMPLVRQAVARLFGRFPRSELQPDEAVALGAGIQAGLVLQDQALDDIVLTDVMPFTLGIGISRPKGDGYEDGHFLPLIERNSFVPVSRVETIVTISDQQKYLNLSIYQGEARRVADNILLGSLAVDVPPRPAGEMSAEVRFTYTLDGILEVECKITSTGQVEKLVIEKAPGSLTPAQITASLLKLENIKQHPREQLVNRQLVAEANAYYEQSLGDQRQFIAAQLYRFEHVLDTQDARQIAAARKEFEALLVHLRSEWE